MEIAPKSGRVFAGRWAAERPIILSGMSVSRRRNGVTYTHTRCENDKRVYLGRDKLVAESGRQSAWLDGVKVDPRTENPSG